MLKHKAVKLPNRVSPQMFLLHLRWQQMRLELLQTALNLGQPSDDGAVKKALVV